jgi:hypothetical protein
VSGMSGLGFGGRLEVVRICERTAVPDKGVFAAVRVR